MKRFRNLFAISFAILALAFVNVNAQGYSSDKSVRNIEQKVFKKINGLPFYGLFDHISFQVTGDTVTLYGKVLRGTNKSSAENVVEDIPGVRRVINNIEILPPSSMDDRIRRQLVREFSNRGGIYRYMLGASPSVRIIVDNGRVALEGYVSSRGDANLMNITANGVFGVFDVENNLVVGKENAR